MVEDASAQQARVMADRYIRGRPLEFELRNRRQRTTSRVVMLLIPGQTSDGICPKSIFASGYFFEPTARFAKILPI
jgi:hypothetical protein